ncbi:MAG: hypothetical protein ACK5WF_19870, partial [Cyclobacteriaceae bacterium]
MTSFDERTELPPAIFFSGIAGIGITMLYNFLQGRISFKSLAILNLILIIGFTAFIEFGESFVENKKELYRFGFILILPFTFITQLIFWGAFSRMFNVRVAKRIIGSVDIGTSIASIIAFFSIPIALASGVSVDALFSIGLVSIVGYLVLFIILSNKYITTEKSVVKSESEIKKLSFIGFITNKYIFALSAFVIISTVALRFIDYSFFISSSAQFEPKDLPVFLSLFEATVVIFSFI